MADTTQLDSDKGDANELLCIRCQRGERAAWEELVETWERPLYYYVKRMLWTHERSCQALQEVWLQVFSSLPSIQNPRRLAPWLYTITRRTVIKSMDQSSPLLTVQTDDEPLPDTSAELDQLSGEDAEHLHWGLDQIAANHREVLVLFFLEDLSLQEIAGVLSIPLGTVKSRLHTARRTLKSALERQENPNDIHA